MDLTAEQQEAVDTCQTGRSMKLIAGAGTGKTTTIVVMARAVPHKRGRYLSFGNRNAAEAKIRMPANVKASTIHGLAYRWMMQTEPRFKERLDAAARLPTKEQVRIMGIPYGGIPTYSDLHGSKMVQQSTCVRIVRDAIAKFCNSPDEAPGPQHIAWQEGIDVAGSTYNNDRVKRELAPCLMAAWADICDPNGRLQFVPDHYLKHFQQTIPVLGLDVLFVDEAQDLDPVQVEILRYQVAAGTQLVLVGDSYQQIHAWRGAVDALEQIETQATSYLTQSFRFGQRIAWVANLLLEQLRAPFQLSGNPQIESTVGTLDAPTAILCRANATAMGRYLDAMQMGRRPFLVGAGAEVLEFARAMRNLERDGWTAHKDLRCFTSVQEVYAYAAEDELGGDLKAMVKLVPTRGLDTILDALGSMPAEADADLTISTAHRAKGLEYAEVAIAEDFRPVDAATSKEERCLTYVAVTRGRTGLDVSMVEGLNDLVLAGNGSRR